ncbi:TetR/AcrR family transcriptional regulator [Pontibacter sp. JAM-7]|uniref:TetR/AcrR family transcriptional regulator n=1 Tax=Pontibacter sp. JAM-7 TaxID=3366581 RepID=UPI003AF632CF
MNTANTQTKSIDTRQRVLDVARVIILGKGYAAVGLNEILQQAGVPKGSFYHYFKSKDEFGRELMEDYFSDYMVMLEGYLSESKLSASQRLMRFFEYWLTTQCSECPEEKCLVVKLSAEVTDLSEKMRIALAQGVEKVRLRLTRCIAEAIAAGEISTTESADELARELYHMWLGATLISKLHRSSDALEAAMKATRQRLTLD